MADRDSSFYGVPATTRELRPGTHWSALWPVGAETDAQFTIPGRWALTAARMRLTDSKLRNFSQARLNPILSARYEVKPGTGPDAERNADYIRRAFGLAGKGSPRVCERSFESIIASAAISLDDGFRVLEPILGPGPDGLWWPKTVIDVESYSIWGWARDEAGELEAVIQQLTRTGMNQPHGRRAADARRLLVFTTDRTGDNYVGGGSLRCCFDWWVMKRDIPALARQALNRYAIPTIVCTKSQDHLRNVERLEDDLIAAAFENADTAAANLQAGESTFLVALGVNGQGINWSILGGGQEVNADTFDKLASLADRQMAAAYLASVVEMGTKGEGSRAVGEVHLDLLASSLGNQLDAILEVIGGPSRPGGGLVGRLLAVNFGEQANEALPTIVHHGLEVDGLADSVGALPSLVAAGLLDAPAIRDRLLRLLGVDVPAPAGDAAPTQPLSADVAGQLDGVPQVGGGGRPEGT